MSLNQMRQCDCSQFDKVDPTAKPPSDRDTFAHYVKHGPIQPSLGFEKDADGRSFRVQWYARYPWLEYSIVRQAAFCFICRLFSIENASAASLAGGQVDMAFVSTGFNKWKKALENGRGFGQHDSSKSHAFAEKAYKEFLLEKPVDVQLSEENLRQVSRRQQTVRSNRQMLGRIFNVVRFIARLSLPFRGHDESKSSDNRGVFLELIQYLAENGDALLAAHMKDAPGNATYLSSSSQNEMIEIK